MYHRRASFLLCSVYCPAHEIGGAVVDVQSAATSRLLLNEVLVACVVHVIIQMEVVPRASILYQSLIFSSSYNTIPRFVALTTQPTYPRPSTQTLVRSRAITFLPISPIGFFHQTIHRRALS